MATLLLLSTFFVALVVSWFINYFKYAKYLRKIPGPLPLPLVGNALEIRSTGDILKAFSKWRARYGTIVTTITGFQPPFIQISGPKELELLLSSTTILDKANAYTFLHGWLGTGLLTSTGEKWKKHRRILTPAFHFQILEQFIDVFNSYSNILVKKLENTLEKDSVNIYSYVTLCSLDIICATAMGTEVNAQDGSDSEYIQSVKEMCRIIMERLFSVYKSNALLYMLTKDYWKERKAVKILHNYTNSVIASRKKELQNNDKLNANAKSVDTDDVGRKKRKTFLDLLLETKDNKQLLTDEEIREEVDTFMFEGHDTTASAITFILYCLATNPDVQNKVIEELNSIFPDKTVQPTHRDLHEMKYLEMVIKETLRLYPSVPYFARKVHTDFEFSGTTLPKGVEIIVLAHAIHKCPKIYPDPERFDPERFTPENQAKRSPYAYVPFSAGSRNCIGQKFAMLEMKAVVSNVIRHYELLPSIPEHEIRLVTEAVLKSSNGVHIRLKKRN